MESLLTTTEDIDQIALNYTNKDRPNSNIINQNLAINLVGFFNFTENSYVVLTSFKNKQQKSCICPKKVVYLYYIN